MMPFIEWITTNGDAIAAALLAIHAAAVAIVNLTPTPQDDEIMAKLYKPIEWLAGILTKKAKE
jgi:hypothetical protein